MLQNTKISFRSLIVFVIVFAGIGSYLIFSSFASNPTIASVQAEQMTLPAGATTVSDSSASAGKAVKVSTFATLKASVNLPSNATGVGITAKGTQCNKAWPKLRLSIDGQIVIPYVSVKSTGYQAYTNPSNLSLANGNHTIAITVDNLGAAKCPRPMYLDVTNFYGPTLPPPAPTVSISATPSSITAGQSSILTWTSTNATNCAGGDAWNGNEPTSGSASTGALNTNATYTLTCTGQGGSATGTAQITVTQSGGGGSAPTNCFSSPGKCGYPDPGVGNVGPVNPSGVSVPCSSLTPSGPLTIDANYVKTHGSTISNLNVNGTVDIQTDNVTLNNDCVTVNGGGKIGSGAVTVESGITGTQVNNSTVAGANDSNQSIEMALVNNYRNPNTSASRDYVYNCGECLHGRWNLKDSYVYVPPGVVPASLNGGAADHYEIIYTVADTINFTHNTLINANEQTSIVFGEISNNNFTLTNNFLVGGGVTIYGGANSSNNGGTMDIESNRFARCLTSPLKDGGDGGMICSGPTQGAPAGNGTGTPGADSHGFFPNGGFFFRSAEMPPSTVWKNNFWDDNLAAVSQ